MEVQWVYDGPIAYAFRRTRCSGNGQAKATEVIYLMRA